MCDVTRLTAGKKYPTLVSTNRPTNGSTGNIYTLHGNIRNTETVNAVTKIGLLLLAEIKMEELATQELTSRTCKHCTKDL